MIEEVVNICFVTRIVYIIEVCMNKRGCLATVVLFGLLTGGFFMVESMAPFQPEVTPETTTPPVQSSDSLSSPQLEIPRHIEKLEKIYPDEPTVSESKEQIKQDVYSGSVLQEQSEHDGILRYYDTTTINASPFDISQTEYRRAQMMNKVSEENIDIVSLSGSKMEANSLDWAQIQALWLTVGLMESNTTFAERDFITHSKSEDTVFVSTMIEPNGTIRITSSKANSLQYAATNKSTLIDQYNLKDIEDGDVQWSIPEINILGDALLFLTAQERALLEGARFRRKKSSPFGSESGFYQFEEDEQSITIFDSAFEGLDCGFVGTVDSPKTTAHHIILHEIGHLLANRPIVQYQRHFNSIIDNYNDLVRQVNAGQPHQEERLEELEREIKELRAGPISRPGPVIKDFQRNRSFSQGPTTYGDSSIYEAFAESYAIFKLDPDALIRIDPGLYIWFASKQYLEYDE